VPGFVGFRAVRKKTMKKPLRVRADRRIADMPQEGTVAWRIRVLRDRLGLTQEQLADLAGLRRSEVCIAERGKNKCSTRRWSDGLAKAAGISSERMGPYLAGQIGLDNLVQAPPGVPALAFLRWLYSSPETLRLSGQSGATVEGLLAHYRASTTG